MKSALHLCCPFFLWLSSVSLLTGCASNYPEAARANRFCRSGRQQSQGEAGES